MPRRDALKLISDTLKNKENDHELVLKIQPYHPRRQNQEKGKLLEEKRGTLYQKGKISQFSRVFLSKKTKLVCS